MKIVPFKSKHKSSPPKKQVTQQSKPVTTPQSVTPKVTTAVPQYKSTDILDKNPKSVSLKQGSNELDVIIRDEPPTMFITRDALRDLQYIIEILGIEGGALGTMRRVGKDLIVEHFLMMPQKARDTQVVFDFEGEKGSKWGLDLYKNDPELYNASMYNGVWFHSHVDMAAFPSAQDDKQMEEFCNELGWTEGLRIIGNKAGDLKVDYYNFEEGFEYHNIPWDIYDSNSEERHDKWEKIIDERITVPPPQPKVVTTTSFTPYTSVKG